MAPGQDKKEPTLELPDLRLPSLKRTGRKRAKAQRPDEEQPSEQRPGEQQPSEQRPSQQRARREGDGAGGRRAPGRVVATLTGVLVGLAGVGATTAGLAGCEAVRGVSTCGGGPGLLLLVGILVLMVLVGGALLTAFGIRDGGATSFLGVGIVAVVAMLALLEVIDSPWMVLVVPAVSGAAYLLAHAVTTRFAGDRGRRDWT